MLDLVIRCSALGGLMTEPKSVDEHLRTPDVAAILRKTKRTDEESALIAALKEESLSAGAKTHVRMLVKQELFGFDNEVSSKEMEKGNLVEAEAIQLLNRVRGLSLVKNTERRTDGFITGECDLYHATANEGRDTKCPWSLASFPIVEADFANDGYWWQAQGYMKLWNAGRWFIDYVMMPTPEHLIRFEPRQLHVVDHIPLNMRVTSWCVPRDEAAIALIGKKVNAARRYARDVAQEFDRLHRCGEARSAAETAITKARAMPAAMPELF